MGESVQADGLVVGFPVSLTICVNVLFSPNNFFISQPIYFILTHIVAYVKTFSQTCIKTLTFGWPWNLTLFFNNFILLHYNFGFLL